MVIGSVLFALVIAAAAAGLAVASGRRIGYTFFPAAAVVGLLAYALCALNLSRLAPYAVSLLAILSAAYVVVKIMFSEKQNLCTRNKLFSLILNSDTALFVLAVILFVLLDRGRLYYLNDEFSHWGLAIKNMFETGRLAIYAESTLFKSYPPFATVFCWLASSFTGGMSEAATFVGMDLLLFSCAMPLPAAFAERLGKNSNAEEPGSGKEKALVWVLTPWVAGIAVAAILCFKLSAFTILSVDTLLGMIGAYMLMAHYTNGSTFGVAVAGAALTLTKEIGIGIALFVLVICAIDRLIAKKRGAAEEDIRAKRKNPMRHLIAPLAVFATWGSWRLVKYFALGAVEKGAADSAAKTAEVTQQTLSAFMKAWIQPRMSVGIPLLLVVAALIAGSVLLALYGKKNAGGRIVSRIRSAGILLTVGGFLFSLGVLIVYLVSFSDYEAMQAASFERYFGTYMTMWLFTLVFGFLLLPGADLLRKRALLRKDRQSSIPAGARIAAAAAVAILPVAAIIVFYAKIYPYSARTSAEFRKSYAQTEQIAEICQSGKTDIGPVLFVKADYENKDWLIANYNASPVKVVYREDWREAVQSGEYSYIYIGKLTSDDLAEDLTSALAEYFSDPESTLTEERLWRIEKTQSSVTGEEKIIFTAVNA